MIEVEVKLKIENKDSVMLKLLELGFEKSTTLKETDTYFDTKSGDIRHGDRALRIRETINYTENTRTSQLNFKDQKLDNKSMTRPEFETEVDDANVTEKILNGLGYFSVTPIVIKSRQTLSSDSINACLDSVDGLGDFLELEMIVEDEQEKEKALLHIEETLHKLGYEMKDTTTVSYLSALQAKL